MVHKILVPVDESSHSHQAIAVAVDLAKQHHSLICLLHAFPHLANHLGSPHYEELIEACTTHGYDVLEAACEEVGHEVPVETQLIEGQPISSILRVAESEQFDMIVMGTRAHTGLARLLTSSVSGGVTKRAHCPVVVVHEN